MAIVPNSDTTLAEAQKIQYKALALETEAKVEIAQAEDTAKKADNSTGNLYMNIASEAVGGGLVKTGLDLLVERVGDKSKNPATETTPDAPGRVSVDQFFGFVRHDAHSVAYGGNPKTATDLSANLLEEVGTATASLRPPIKDTEGLVQADKRGNICGTKAEVNNQTLQSAKFAEKLVFDQKYANETALNAMPTWNQQYSAARGQALGMGAAPAALHNFSPKNLAALASEEATGNGS